MKKRKKLTRREKATVAKAVAKALTEGHTNIEVETEKRTYHVMITDDGEAILPSGKVFKMDRRHIV